MIPEFLTNKILEIIFKTNIFLNGDDMKIVFEVMKFTKKITENRISDNGRQRFIDKLLFKKQEQKGKANLSKRDNISQDTRNIVS